ncbi:acyl-CoA N-acyltransferase [Umbelopsis sp. PMI_123]|nr:acyl-CoA N-acyltransferase [Umbelopsis sp. PMI_123]
MEKNLSDLSYRHVKQDDLDTIANLETNSYDPEEAASRESIAKRIDIAQTRPALFLVATAHTVIENCDMELGICTQEEVETVIAFVNATLTGSDLITEESMHNHDDNGTTVAIHSVCVSPQYRGQGIAQQLLNNYLDGLRAASNRGNNKQYKRVALLSRPQLVDLYEKVGFKCIGQSSVVHGPEPWFDCIIDL